ncbi:MAG: DUF1549 domain-containing protein, partial [Pirellulaceae bacterium]|nr:DUF1549 domain-containing protein [Pirellulaceae bacterium]
MQSHVVHRPLLGTRVLLAMQRCPVPLGLLLLTCLASGLWSAEPTAEQLEDFEKHVRPVLVEHCYECHSAKTNDIKGGLRLDSHAAAMAGGDSGTVIVPGKPDDSLLIEAIRWETSGFQMPPKSRLPAEAIAALEQWVKGGAAWPPETEASGPAPQASFDIAARRAAHWCWQSPVAIPPPEVKDALWPTGPVDQFLLARLEQSELQPAPPADRRTLIRRASFDLLGLPPTPEEVESFVADPAADAFAKLVDRLLQSPHFGRRWARHWLDLVRYAESRGHEFDPTIPNAWQYRDYVVRALNADVPYDQFVREHLAGDLIAPRLGPEGENESILGTGFWFLGEEVHSPVDIRQDEADRMDNRLDVMGKTFLALTVGCARCHDHKFDALSQRDYYALTGFLISSSYRQARFATLEEDRRIAAELDALRAAAEPRLRRAVGETLQAAAARLPAWLTASGRALSGGSVAEVAAAAGLAAPAVSAGSEELKAAKANPADPLFAFAAALNSIAGGAGNAAEVAQTVEAAVQRMRQHGEGAASVAPEAVVVDYGKLAPGHWLQDGFSFGFRPARTGDFRFSLDGDWGVAGLVTRGCAQRDAVWASLKPAGSERDHGVLGGWDRPGQTLRTPETTLNADRLWYLVRGAGRAYAVVNNHLIVAGPLHGGVLREWNDDSGRWQWVEHSLGAYRGHRVHVEFTPRDDGDFAVAQVVCSADRPPPPEQTNPLVLEALADARDQAPESVAAALGRVCEQAARDVRDGRTDQPGSAALAGWLFRHLDALTAGLDQERANQVASAREFRAAQAALARQIQRETATAPAMFEGSGVDEVFLVRGSTKT